MSEKTIGGFLHRLLDLLEQGAQTRDFPDRRWRMKYEEEIENEDSDENVFVCQSCVFIEEQRDDIEEHIEEEHGVGSYEEMPAKSVMIGGGSEEPFQGRESEKRNDWQPGNFPELSKEERKDRIRDWFNQHCEKAPTIPDVCREVFGKKDVENGDMHYSGTWEALNELNEEGFLSVFKDGAWNRYYSDREQVESLRRASA